MESLEWVSRWELKQSYPLSNYQLDMLSLTLDKSEQKYSPVWIHVFDVYLASRLMQHKNSKAILRTIQGKHLQNELYNRFATIHTTLMSFFATQNFLMFYCTDVLIINSWKWILEAIYKNHVSDVILQSTEIFQRWVEYKHGTYFVYGFTEQEKNIFETIFIDSILLKRDAIIPKLEPTQPQIQSEPPKYKQKKVEQPVEENSLNSMKDKTLSWYFCPERNTFFINNELWVDKHGAKVRDNMRKEELPDYVIVYILFYWLDLSKRQIGKLLGEDGKNNSTYSRQCNKLLEKTESVKIEHA